MGKCERTKRGVNFCGKLEETTRPVHLDSSQRLGDKAVPFLQLQGGHSSPRFLWPASREGQRVLPTYDVSQIQYAIGHILE